MLHEDLKYHGSTTVGERGQIVLPAKLREKFKIKEGDKILVLAGEKMGAWSIILIKASVMTRLMSKILGRDINKILKDVE